jgi:hypothetical protein
MEKRRFRLCLAVTVGIVSLALCSDSGAALSLQLKLAKGKTYYQRIRVDQHSTSTAMGRQQVMEMTQATGMKLDVLDVDGQGNMQIRNTFVWVMFRQTNPEQMSYDSAQQSTPPPGMEAPASLLNESCTITVSPAGKVIDVSGLEQMQAAVRKKLPPGEESKMAMDSLAMYFDKATVRQMTEANMAIYPEKPVNVGDSWAREVILIAGGSTMIAQSKWTLLKDEAGVATIGVARAIRSDPNSPATQAGEVQMKSEMTGTQEGTIQVAEATGLPFLHKERQQLKGQVRLIGAPNQPPVEVIPMTVETQITGDIGDKMWQPTTQ